jgi:hypothetical protein
METGGGYTICYTRKGTQLTTRYLASTGRYNTQQLSRFLTYYALLAVVHCLLKRT